MVCWIRLLLRCKDSLNQLISVFNYELQTRVSASVIGVFMVEDDLGEIWDFYSKIEKSTRHNCDPIKGL